LNREWRWGGREDKLVTRVWLDSGTHSKDSPLL
jgi:hypothetical protein